MPQPAKYVYCIVRCREERSFEVAAIGDRTNPVQTINHDGLAVVASDSPDIRYDNSRSNMVAHEKVLETVMQELTLLPVRFGTVASALSPEDSIQNLLRIRGTEFTELLDDIDGKVELGLKAFWRDEKAIFDEILVENPEIARVRSRLAGKRPEAVRFEAIELGRMVKEALEAKKGREAARLLSPLTPLADRVRENNTMTDRMILNASFLIDVPSEAAFDRAVEDLDSRYGARMGLKYVGPTPPYNFVDIVVNWEECIGTDQP
ncbi:MAG: GvpL/GvpF family gas vesicle protein [Dehalococcoidia bacterium]|nr:GvpL/GvpF family gas vesicle protein [Dehalococcoidia bacterium]